MDIKKMLASGMSPDEIMQTFCDNFEIATNQMKAAKEEGLCALSSEIYNFLRTHYPEEFKKAGTELRHMLSPVELDGFFHFVLEHCTEESSNTSDSITVSSLSTVPLTHPLNMNTEEKPIYTFSNDCQFSASHSKINEDLLRKLV